MSHPIFPIRYISDIYVLQGTLLVNIAALPSPSEAERSKAAAFTKMGREDQIVEGLKLLTDRATFIGVHILQMADDGNCQFRALSHELFGHERHHLVVRARVIAYLRAHASEYSFYVGDESDWSHYLSVMCQDRTWGDELTLRAASEAFGSVVHVVTSEKENWLLQYGQPLDEPRQRHLFLAYVSPIHYNVVAPLETP